MYQFSPSNLSIIFYGRYNTGAKRSHSNSIICIEAWANEINAIQRSHVSVFFKITYIEQIKLGHKYSTKPMSS